MSNPPLTKDAFFQKLILDGLVRGDKSQVDFITAKASGMSQDEAADATDRAARARIINAKTMQLPIGGMTEEYKTVLEAEGFVFTGNIKGMFEEVQAPEGWKLEPTDHPMWSDLLDAKGCKRGAMFYKAAPWDTKSHIQLNRRFTARFNHNDADSPHERDTPSGTPSPLATTTSRTASWASVCGKVTPSTTPPAR